MKSNTDYNPGLDFWYVKSLIEKKSFQIWLLILISIAGIERYFINHSLRVSIGGHLYHKNDDKQLIWVKTGYQNNAINTYKCNITEIKQ